MNAQYWSSACCVFLLVDIQMSRYGGFDYDKSEQIIAIGRKKTQQTLGQQEM